MTSSAAAVPGLRTRKKYVAAVPAYLRFRTAPIDFQLRLAAEQFLDGFRLEVALGDGDGLDAQLARFAGGELDFDGLATPGGEVADFERARRLPRRRRAAAGRFCTFSATPVPGFESVRRYTCGLPNSTSSGPVTSILSFGSCTSTTAREPTGSCVQVTPSSSGRLARGTRSMSSVSAAWASSRGICHSSVAGESSAAICRTTPLVAVVFDHLGPGRNAHGRHDGFGRDAALVLQPHAVRRLAADGDLLRAADVGRDRRGLRS